MSEIRVENVIGETGNDAVKFTKGINVTGIATATNVSVGSSVTAATFHGSGANLTNVSAGKVLNYVSDADNTEYDQNVGTTYTAIHGSNLQLSITPSATSSRILIMFNWGALASYQY